MLTLRTTVYNNRDTGGLVLLYRSEHGHEVKLHLSAAQVGTPLSLVTLLLYQSAVDYLSRCEME